MKHQTLEIFLIIWIVILFCVSCNKYQPLKKAKMPCMVTFEDTTNWKFPVMKVLDDDKVEFHFISIPYCKKYNENDVIHEPLN